MRAFRLTDEAFAELAAGRPSTATVAKLRRAQISRHLLLLTEILKLPGGKIPPWYADPAPGLSDARQEALADPMVALHTAATLAALRSGAPPPPDRMASPRHLTATHDGLTVSARLEDTDPLRSRLGLTPSRQLTPTEVTEWQRLLSAAWQILTTRHRDAAETLSAVLRVIVPIEPDPGAAGLSATSSEAFGAVALSTPADPVSLAVGLLHETQHSLLNATRTLFDLIHPDAPATYSPWRDDPRPPFGLLHGAYAYQALTRFWRTEAGVSLPPRPLNPDKSSVGGRRGHETGDGLLAEFEFARWRVAVVDTADALLAGEQLTTAGMRFVRALRDEMGAWLGEAVDADVERLARGANAEHRARWRLRNLVVDTEALVDAWRHGRTPTIPESTLRVGGGRALERSERLDLVHRVLRAPAGALWADQSLQPGDVAYLRGEAGTALDAYMKEVESLSRRTRPDHREMEAWAGIAIVSPHQLLRERPEVVRAVYLAVGDIDLDTVAKWLGGSLNFPAR